MASQTRTKLYKVESKSAKTGVKTYRHSIFLEKAFVEDSLFPFKAGENLIVRIDRDRLIVTKFKDQSWVTYAGLLAVWFKYYNASPLILGLEISICLAVG